jgi:Cd2+/Zn2+-exporting ATPase
MFSRLITVYRNPAERRKWLTIASGLFIAAALVAFYGFGQAAPWASLMPRS